MIVVDKICVGLHDRRGLMPTKRRASKQDTRICFSFFERENNSKDVQRLWGGGIFSRGMGVLDRRARGGFFVLGLMLCLDVHYPPYSFFFFFFKQ